MKRYLVYTTDDSRTRPIDPTRFLASATPQNRRFRVRVEKDGLRAKPDKNICRLSGCDAEFVKDALHGVSQVMVVAIDGSWVLCTVGGGDFLSGRE